MLFRVGDKVRVVKKGNCESNCGECFINCIGKIQEINQKTGRIFVYSFEYRPSGCSAFTEECLELVESKIIKVFGIAKFCKEHYK